MRRGEHPSRLEGEFEDIDALGLGQDDEFILLESFPYILVLVISQESLELVLTCLKMLDRRLKAGDLLEYNWAFQHSRLI